MKSSRGQSIVELALVMPILIILIAGLVEIGWYAYNYITLTEVARQVARTGTTMIGDMSPLYWEDPDSGLFRGSAIEDADSVLRLPWLAKYRNCRPSDPNADLGFYNYLGCVAIQSMNPLRVEGFEPGKSITDDIIISGFTVAPDGDSMKVLQRYPHNASECVPNSVRESLGFAWGGNYRNADGCLGSEFSNAEIEQMMNLNGFEKGVRPSNLESYLQPQGIVMVELHWEHETLTQLVGLSPVFSPVLEILGVHSTISVWAAFPLPQVEREILNGNN